MIDFELYHQQLAEKGYLSPYIVQLMLEESPQIDKDSLLEALRKHSGDVESIEEQSGVIGFTHKEKGVREGEAPAQSLFGTPEVCENPVKTFSASLIQTWDWQEAEQVLSKVKAVVSITFSFAESHNRKDRLELVHNIVLNSIDLYTPVAIHWFPSQRIVSPLRYKEDLSQGGQLFSSAVNVRMFKVENSEERVMDTLGLTAFGLSDIQCNFLDLDPKRVGVYLYELADYVFRRGDIFQTGDTIDALQAGDKWTIRKEQSYVNPSRRVIDILPGQNAPQTTQE